MPFVLSQKSSYTWPVKYEYPKDGGRFEPVEFNAEFKRLPQSRLDEIHKAAKNGTLEDISLIEEVLLGWSAIKTTSGDEFECNDANRSILLDLPGMRAAIVNAFAISITGAPRKN